MPQHIAYIYTVADIDAAKQALVNWWANDVAFSHDQITSHWLLHYVEWLDPWLSSWEYGMRLKALGIKIHSYMENAWHMKPSAANIEVLKKRVRKKYQFEETRWLDTRLLEAMNAYSGVRIRRRVHLFNRCTAAALADSELTRSIRAMKNIEINA